MTREQTAARIAGLLKIFPKAKPWYEASPAELAHYLADGLELEDPDDQPFVPVPRELLEGLRVRDDSWFDDEDYEHWTAELAKLQGRKR